MRSSTFYALIAAASSVQAAAIQGFNYGSTQTDGTIKVQQDFLNEFNAAKALVGTSGFTSARLYTMIQGGTANTPISAIPAAIASKTTLLLGLWASGGQTGIDNEILALKAAISQYGTSFTSLVTGISVGSEDLYRISPTGIAAMSGIGADPATVVSYITQVRSAIAGTALSGASIGHVDTWTAWVNGSNSAVINAVDWVGMDAYPYFQSTQANGIENGKGLFNDALTATRAAVGGKSVWVTETGWPVSGSVSGSAVASTANAKTYWDEVGCPLFGTTNTYWFTLQDAYPTTPNPSFGIVGSTLSTTPLFDLSCSAVSSSSSVASSSTSAGASSASTASATNTAAVLSSAQSAATAQTGAQAPSQGNGVGSSSARAPATSSYTNGTSPLTTAVGGSPTVATLSTAKTTVTGAAAGTGAGAASSKTATTSASTTGYTGAAAPVGAGSVFAAAGALAAAMFAL